MKRRPKPPPEGILEALPTEEWIKDQLAKTAAEAARLRIALDALRAIRMLAEPQEAEAETAGD